MIPDDADAPFLASPPATAGSEWGIAALATGGILLVAGFPGILLIMILAMNWPRLIAAGDTGLIATIGYIGYTLGFLTTLLATFSAVRGLVGASRQGRSVAWAIHGLLICGIAVIVWGIALFSWFKCIEDAHRQQRQSIPQYQFQPLR